MIVCQSLYFDLFFYGKWSNDNLNRYHANAVILVFVWFEKAMFLPNICWYLCLYFLMFILIWSIPCAPSRSNHYVEKVGGHHRMLICTLDFLNASPWTKRAQFRLSVSALRAQSLGFNEQSVYMLFLSFCLFVVSLRIVKVDKGWCNRNHWVCGFWFRYSKSDSEPFREN